GNVDQVLVRQQRPDLAQHRQSANAGIEYADRGCADHAERVRGSVGVVLAECRKNLSWLRSELAALIIPLGLAARQLGSVPDHALHHPCCDYTTQVARGLCTMAATAVSNRGRRLSWPAAENGRGGQINTGRMEAARRQLARSREC